MEGKWNCCCGSLTPRPGKMGIKSKPQDRQGRKEGGSRWHLREEMRPQDLGWLIRSTFSQYSKTQCSAKQSNPRIPRYAVTARVTTGTLGSRLVLMVLVCWVSSLID